MTSTCLSKSTDALTMPESQVIPKEMMYGCAASKSPWILDRLYRMENEQINRVSSRRNDRSMITAQDD